MKISEITVTYGELRSKPSKPGFSNQKIEVALRATMDPHESPEASWERLLNMARTKVWAGFGDY